MNIHVRGIFGATSLVCALLLPLTVSAQVDESAQLRSEIRSALLSDPRSLEVSETDLNTVIEQLVGEAKVQGLTPYDITWRPAAWEEFETQNAARCGGVAPFLCALNEAFGFDGSDPRIPIGLGLCSALLLFLIGMLLHHVGKHPVSGVLQEPAT